jgi:predicted transcriptional regulator
MGDVRQPRHRTKSEIIPSILEVTNGNKVRITEIELKACLPYNIAKEYLAHLVHSGLIEYIEGERAYKTTPKGVQVLITYHMLEEMFAKSH